MTRADIAGRPAPADRTTGERLHVLATAGHVDHGKSSLIVRLTGIDPDRWAEEKRRGLTIDLGFAWTTLPSGREIGFVDVPGHERFIRNMLAGVGPVRLILFVVAADEGWKPQSEEHLQIVDVLGAHGGVVALTKQDLVDEQRLAVRVSDVRRRLSGTRLESAAIVPCSAATGAGIDQLRAALDRLVESAPEPESNGRVRHFLDRVFTIKGAGTVVTGTLTGGPLSVGQEAEILPPGHRVRIRGLQTHKRVLQTAVPVSRVAVNLTGVSRENIGRGDVLCAPGEWRSTAVFDAAVGPVRGLDHPLGVRGAYKLYVGSAERDAAMRFFPSGTELRAGGPEVLARITIQRPVVLDVGDRFVLREAGRRETVAGGRVIDVEPPRQWDGEHAAMLEARRAAPDRRAVAELLVRERRFLRSADVFTLTGVRAQDIGGSEAVPLGPWMAGRAAVEAVTARLGEAVAAHHEANPLRPGLDITEARAVLADADRLLEDPALADAVLAQASGEGRLDRSSAFVRLPGHRSTTAGRADADRLVESVRAAEPSPPTVKELMGAGFGRDLIEATCADGRLVRISSDLVVTPEFLSRAEEALRSAAGATGTTGTKATGVSVSAFRQVLGTSRKYAVPVLEYFDAHGVTTRRGDLRILR